MVPIEGATAAAGDARHGCQRAANNARRNSRDFSPAGGGRASTGRSTGRGQSRPISSRDDGDGNG
eukprot:scaffold238287_cov24-Attheya_sp.AAC.1